MTEDFDLVWKRICDNQGNKFLTIRKESVEYKIEYECFIPLRPNKTPADYFEGRKEARLAERREKLHTADFNRKAYWLQQQQA